MADFGNLQVPGIRAMAEEFDLTCITAMRMDSTKAVLQNGTDRQRRAESQQAAVPIGGGAADGVAAAPAASEPPQAAAANGGDTAPASSAAADSRDGADSLAEGNDSSAAPGAAADCRTGGGASPPAAANGGEYCTAGDGAAAAAAPGPENERQRARRERKAAGMRMRGLQPPPRLLSAATEPAARCDSQSMVVTIEGTQMLMETHGVRSAAAPSRPLNLIFLLCYCVLICLTPSTR